MSERLHQEAENRSRVELRNKQQQQGEKIATTYEFNESVVLFNISFVFSNARLVLSQRDTRLRLLRLLYDIEVIRRKTINHAFCMCYTLMKHGF